MYTSPARKTQLITRRDRLVRAAVSRQRRSAAAARLFDILAAGFGILALSPILIVTAIAIWIEDRGPVLYISWRAGRGGRPFRFFKFRSMFRDAEARKAELLAQNESADGVIFKMKHDPRITRVGRLIRRTSIDELPQLFNVLFGDMSLIGPRPHPVKEVAEYNMDARQRLDVVPGITCSWQVEGRSDIPFNQQIVMDKKWISQRGVRFNLMLLLKTIPAVLTGRGAY
jgi:lipopolysaccharide/colanic/teichoic acid biosynthesis glycosyltransferase